MALRLAAPLLFVCLVLAGCGGGGSTTTPAPTASPLAGAAFTQTGTVTPSGNAVTLPAAGSYAATLGFSSGSLPAGVTVAATVTNQAPSGIGALASRRTIAATSFASDAILYLGLTFSATTSASGALTIQTTIPSGVVPSGDVLWLALYDPTTSPAAWQYGIAGPAQGTNGSASFTIPGGYPFQGAAPYWFAVYALPANLATPTPVAAALSVTPASLTLSGTGTPNAASLAIVEPNYKGYFQVSSADTTVATVSPALVIGPSGSIVVTPTGGGATTITISDQNGQLITVKVGVTTGTVNVNGSTHHD